MGLWESIIIVTVFSVGVIVIDEIIHARRRRRREQAGGVARLPH
jgi:chloramphenicol 3-O-phosphotransferase